MLMFWGVQYWLFLRNLLRPSEAFHRFHDVVCMVDYTRLDRKATHSGPFLEEARNHGTSGFAMESKYQNQFSGILLLYYRCQRRKVVSQDSWILNFLGLLVQPGEVIHNRRRDQAQFESSTLLHAWRESVLVYWGCNIGPCSWMYSSYCSPNRFHQLCISLSPEARSVPIKSCASWNTDSQYSPCRLHSIVLCLANFSLSTNCFNK